MVSRTRESHSTSPPPIRRRCRRQPEWLRAVRWSVLSGLVVLVDRGACNFTLKINIVGEPAALLASLACVAPGAPFLGGRWWRPDHYPRLHGQPGRHQRPQGLGAATATVDPAIPLTNRTMVGSSRVARRTTISNQARDRRTRRFGISNRRKRHRYRTIWWYLGCSSNGRRISCLAPDGFGQTRRATPPPHVDAGQTKALLMNNAETKIDINPCSGWPRSPELVVAR